MTDEERMIADIRKWHAEGKLVIGRDHWEAALRLLDARDREIAERDAALTKVVCLSTLLREAQNTSDGIYNEMAARVEKAEIERDAARAQVAALREALEEISAGHADPDRLEEVARDALAALDSPGD